jgi:hypothetical protein
MCESSFLGRQPATSRGQGREELSFQSQDRREKVVNSQISLGKVVVGIHNDCLHISETILHMNSHCLSRDKGVLPDTPDNARSVAGIVIWKAAVL